MPKRSFVKNVRLKLSKKFSYACRWSNQSMSKQHTETIILNCNKLNVDKTKVLHFTKHKHVNGYPMWD